MRPIARCLLILPTLEMIAAHTLELFPALEEVRSATAVGGRVRYYSRLQSYYG